MTTDITELAQREKFEVWAEHACAAPWGYLKKRRTTEGYSEQIYTCMWTAWKAAGAELVEALEKAQRYIEELREWNAGLAQESFERQQRIAELESFRTAYMEWSDKTDWMQGDKRFDVVRPLGKHRVDVLKAYIEHLESRTVTPVTYSENADADHCRKWAWEQVKGEVETEGWTTGDNITYFGFFCWGWDMRRQYNEQRPVTVKLPQRLQPGADGYDDWYVHSDDDGEYLKFDDVLAMLTAAGIKVEGE